MDSKKKSANARSLLENILFFGIILLFIALPLVYFSNRVASYVTSKEYFFIGTIDVLTVLWLWLLLIDKRYRFSKVNFLYLLPFLLLLVSLTISAFTGVDTANSFFSTVESGTGLLFLWHVFLMSCIVTSFVRVHQQKFITYFIQATLLASIALSVVTFIKSVNSPFIGNPLLLGAYFIFSIFLTILLILKERNIIKRIFYCIGLIIILFSPIYFNISGQFFIGRARIATVALIVGLVISFFVYLILQKRNKILKKIGIIGLLLVTVIAVFSIKQVVTPNTSLHKFFISEAGNRTVDWRESIEGIKARPVFGWGPENFHIVYQRYFNPIVLSPQRGDEAWALHPHNNTLEILIDGGILGFIFYLLVLVGIIIGLVRLYKKGILDDKNTALLTGMFITFFIQQQMIYDSILSYVMFFSIIAIVAGLSAPNDEDRYFAQTSVSNYIIGFVIIIIMFPVWLYSAYLPARKTEELEKVATEYADQRINQYQHLFHSPGSYAINNDIEFYTDPLFFSYSAQEQILKANPSYQKIASQELAALFAAVTPVWINKPYDYHLTLSLIQLENFQFYLTGDKYQLANADMFAKRAFGLSSTDPQIYVAYAQTLVYENNISQAEVLLAKAISLNGNYQPALDFKKELQN